MSQHLSVGRARKLSCYASSAARQICWRLTQFPNSVEAIEMRKRGKGRGARKGLVERLRVQVIWKRKAVESSLTQML